VDGQAVEARFALCRDVVEASDLASLAIRAQFEDAPGVAFADQLCVSDIGDRPWCLEPRGDGLARGDVSPGSRAFGRDRARPSSGIRRRGGSRVLLTRALIVVAGPRGTRSQQAHQHGRGPGAEQAGSCLSVLSAWMSHDLRCPFGRCLRTCLSRLSLPTPSPVQCSAPSGCHVAARPLVSAGH